MAFAESALQHLPAGGATPFAECLSLAWQLIRSERTKNPGVRPVLVIISDGDANVPVSPEAEPLEELETLAEKIARDRVAAVFIDAAERQKGESQMQRLAGRMQASCITISDLSASAILDAVLSYDGPQ
jgi:magnesium chelatase subunit D